MPSFSAFLPADGVIVARFAIETAQKFGHVQLSGDVAPMSQLAQKIFTLVAAALNSRKKIRVGRGNSQVGKFLRAESADWTHHHCGKRNVLPRIVEHVQQRRHDLNFRRLKIFFLVGHEGGHSEFFQRVEDFKCLRLRRTVQNHDVAQLQRSAGVAVANEFARRKEFMNFVRNETHFKRNALVVVVSVAPGLDVVKFGAFVEKFFAAVVACAILQSRRVVVVNFSHARIHQPLENFVDRRENLLTTAEIFRQVDTAEIGVRHFVAEVGGVDEAETVNRLLDVADEKQIIAARNFLDNRFLHSVGVLIFVDHDEFEFAAVSGSDVGRGVEYVKRKVFHVAEVDYITFTLGGGEFFCKSLRHAHELTNRRGKRFNVGEHLIFVGKKIFFAQVDKPSFVAAAQGRNFRFDGGVALARAVFVELDRPNFFVKRVPIVERSFQRGELRGVVGKDVDGDVVGGGKVLSVRAVVENFFQRRVNVRLDELKPIRVGKSGTFGQVVWFGERIKPRVGIGHT